MRLALHIKTFKYLKKKKLRKKGFIHTSNKVNKDLGYGLISESSHGTLRSAET